MILLVDDKQENLYSLKTLLQLHAYDADTAASGEEALKKILRNDYALVILDVQMPGMDGYEVAETITGYSKTKNIPIIFLSAVNIDKRFIAKGYASGGVDYITKPFDPDLLLLKVKTFCKLYEQTKALKTMQETLKEEIEIRKQTQKALEEANLRLEDKVEERTKALSQANKELETSNAELQQYASVASHDLQEPLRKIITFTGVVREKFLAGHSEAEPYMKKVASAAERMRSLINDLLNYSKLSSAVHFKPANLNQILNETLSDLELSIHEKGAKVTVEELPSAEVIPGQIRQVFQNIISNSLKFSKINTSPEIKIWSDLTASKSFDAPANSKGKYLRIYIRDNGIGFNEQFLGKVFTLFQRLHGRSEYEGTGIGLAIVKKIIEKHNGLVTAKTKEGEGATFIVLLPLQQSLVSAQPILHR
ncbi:hybrid sensor histidine kinase/response regulator [Flavisolibacter ginsenosidimutans]|uniref:histidine kinase n=1 Tax=Flavisolibacter ginsenosidimutans TaxID=661481 RepID=A0A5B8UGL5_9BACT|nr:response regulator [Flavisolibacter ginsenosidimutans]QEC55648.1 response regulator [Flavisolibacter ginsenosidimutans]